MDTKIAEYDHEEAILGVMVDQMLDFLITKEKNSDWLHHSQETSTATTTTTAKDKDKSTDEGPDTLDLLKKLSELQLKPEERLSELTYQVSETKEEEYIWLTRAEYSELMGQLEELKIRRDNVEKLLESVSRASDDTEVQLKKRKTVLQEDNNKNHETNGSASSAGDTNMDNTESYLQDKYAPVSFDEDKAQSTLNRLESLQKERADQIKRLTSPTGEFLLPSVPIPPNIHVAQEQIDERKAYLNELKEKIEALTSSAPMK